MCFPAYSTRVLEALLTPRTHAPGMAATRREDDGDRTVYRESQRAFLALRLVTEVRPSGLYVRLGPLQRGFRHVPSEEIAAVSVDSYSAADHGG